jgi:hypothetical protein
MKFRTEITIAPWSEQIGYNDKIVCLGSCFASNIAGKLRESKFNVTDNPTGILFNPKSIARSVAMMRNGARITEEDIFERNGRYVSYLFHSSISGATPEEALNAMNNALNNGRRSLEEATLIIITLGSAYVWRDSSGEVVANCHKMSAKNFSNELLTTEQVTDSLREIIDSTKAKIFFTVSPVRHLNDGLEGNSLSKAILRVATNNIICQHPNRASYFPAYELVIDDLRDYRFYAEDMLHPSAQAVEYVTGKFFEAALSYDAKKRQNKVLDIVQARAHRPLNPHSEAYRNFCQTQLKNIAELRDIDFSEEKEYFEQMLQINL